VSTLSHPPLGGSRGARKTADVLHKPSVLPGFGLTMGFTLVYLGLVVLLPQAALILKSSGLYVDAFWATRNRAARVAAYRLSFGASFAAASVNLVFGVLVSWVLVPV